MKFVHVYGQCFIIWENVTVNDTEGSSTSSLMMGYFVLKSSLLVHCMMDPSPSDVKKGAGLTRDICANVNANAGMFMSHVWLVMP